MKNTITLKKVSKPIESIVEAQFDGTPIITLYDTYSDRSVSINNADTWESVYFRTNKLRDTEVKAMYESATGKLYINAMDARQYLDLDEEISVVLDIQAGGYMTYHNFLKFYNYDLAFDLKMLTLDLNHIAYASFAYNYKPYSKIVNLFKNNNSVSTNVKYLVGSKYYSSSNISGITQFISPTFVDNSLVTLVSENTFINPDIQIFETVVDTSAPIQIILPKYDPDVTFQMNPIDGKYVIGKRYSPNIILDFTNVTKFYIDGVLSNPDRQLGINYECKSDTGKVINTREYMGYNTTGIQNVSIYPFEIDEPGNITNIITFFRLGEIANLVYASSLQLGTYIRMTVRWEYTLFETVTISNQSQLDVYKTEDSYFLPVMDLNVDLQYYKYFQLTPVNVGDIPTINESLGDEVDSYFQGAANYIISYADFDAGFTISVNGVLTTRNKTNETGIPALSTVTKLHVITEKYQSNISIVSYENITYTLYQMNDDKLWDTVETNNIDTTEKILSLPDGIFRINIVDSLGTYDYIFVAYPTILNGNTKYLGSLLQSYPSNNPHASFYDFNVFITLKDTLYRKLNYMYSFDYTYQDLYDALISELYVLKDLIDNLKKYVPA